MADPFAQFEQEKGRDPWQGFEQPEAPEPTAASAGPDEPGLVQRAAQLATMPGRGGRALGVLAQQLGADVLQPKKLVAQALDGDGKTAQAFERAAEAVKPEYQPKEGERAGSFIGRLVGDAPLYYALGAAVGPAAAAPVVRAGAALSKVVPGAAAMVPAGVEAAAPAAAKVIEAATRYGASASVGGVLNAAGNTLDQMSAKGEVDAKDVAQAAAGGALLAAGLHMGGDAAINLLMADSTKASARVLGSVVNRARQELQALKTRYERSMGIATPENPQIVPSSVVPADLVEAVATGKTSVDDAAQAAGERFMQTVQAESASMLKTPQAQERAIAPAVEMMVKSGIPPEIAVGQASAALERALASAQAAQPQAPAAPATPAAAAPQEPAPAAAPEPSALDVAHEGTGKRAWEMTADEFVDVARAEQPELPLAYVMDLHSGILERARAEGRLSVEPLTGAPTPPTEAAPAAAAPAEPPAAPPAEPPTGGGEPPAPPPGGGEPPAPPPGDGQPPRVPPSEEPLSTKQQIAKATGLAKEKIEVPEVKALGEKLAAEARGAKTGYAQGKKEAKAQADWDVATMRQKLENRVKSTREEGRERARQQVDAVRQKLEDKLAYKEREAKVKGDWEAAIKREITQIVNEHIPLKERGRFVAMVRDAKTPKDITRALFRVRDTASEIHKRELIGDIRKITDRALESGGVDAVFKKRIRDFLADIELKGHSPEALERLRGIEEYLRHARETGAEVDMPESVLEQVAILGRRPIKSLSEGELENVLDGLRALEQFGRTAKAARTAVYEMQRDRLRDQLVMGTKPMEKHAKIERKPGGPMLGTEAQIKNAIAQALDVADRVDMALMPMDVVVDMLGEPNRRLVKDVLDARYGEHRQEFHRLMDPVRDLAEQIKIDKAGAERIGIHAIRSQEGGEEKLLASGLTADEIKAVKLTPQEQQVYELMRKKLDETLPAIVRTLREVYNKEIKGVKNYFPFLRDWDQVSESHIIDQLGESLEGLGRPTKTVEQGFTQERKGGSSPVVVDALEAFETHMELVTYFNAMQRDLKMIAEAVNSPEYGKAAGEVGQRIMREWIDVVARRGGADGAQRVQILDMLRRNLGVANLAFNLQSVLVQPTALFDASAMIGGKYVGRGLMDVVTEPAWDKFLMENFPELRDRVADDPSFRELASRKAAKLGLKALQKMDALAAKAAVAGAYRKNLESRGLDVDLSKPDQDGIREATRMLRRTQASPIFKDLALALSRGGLTGNRSLDKTIFQFQGFKLNRWSLWRHEIPKMWKEGRKDEAAWAALYLGMANLAEMGIRHGVKAAIAGVLSGAGIAVAKKKKKEEFTERAFMQALDNVPFLGSFAQAAVYHSSPVPLVDALQDVLVDGLGKGTVGAIKATTGETPKARKKGRAQIMRSITEALTGAAKLAGVPGVAQVRNLVRAAETKK